VKYVLHFAADAEHLKHVGHYQAVRKGLGARYLADFERAMHEVCEAPNRCRIEMVPDIPVASLARFRSS